MAKANTIVLGSEQISINDSNGNTVVLEGVLPNGQTGIQVEDGNGLPVAQLGSFVNGLSGFKILDTNGIGVAFLGRDSSGSTSIKVADSGIDVTTASNDQLIFNSNQNVYKIVKTMTVTVTITYNASSGTNAISTTPHGLSFTPAYLAYISIPSDLSSLVDGMSLDGPNPYVAMAVAGAPTVALIPTINCQITVDATNILFYAAVAVSGSGTDTFTGTVNLLQQTFSGD